MSGASLWWRVAGVGLAGALLVWAVAALVRVGLTALLEPRGHWLDRWRRVWFHPERELGRLLEAFLIVAFVAGYFSHYALPAWGAIVVAGVWALHLPADTWSWLRLQRRRDTRALHERGFLLLELGPLWLRVGVTALAAALYLLPGVRPALNTVVNVLVAILERCFG